MYIVRPIEPSDLDAFEECAKKADIGLTNLPKKREDLEARIRESLASFHKEVEKPENEIYTFVLEKRDTGEVGGTCSLYAHTGIINPLLFYRLETDKQNRQILCPVSYSRGPSEICALYILPEFRKGGLGRLLSLSRFLFIASHRKRFDRTIIAEMRGVIHHGHSPFWEEFGRRLCDVSFSEVFEKQKDWVVNILPQWPVYLALLPKEVQEVIGKTSLETTPALKILENEGFNITTDVDIFDAGPKMEAHTKEIRTIKRSCVAKVEEICKELPKSEKWLLSNEDLNFRACYGEMFLKGKGKVKLHENTAEALNVERGGTIRFVNPK